MYRNIPISAAVAPAVFKSARAPPPPPQLVTLLYSRNVMRDWAHVSVGSLVPSAVEIESLECAADGIEHCPGSYPGTRNPLPMLRRRNTALKGNIPLS